LEKNLPVPHPFAFFLAKGWETAKAKRTNSCGQNTSLVILPDKFIDSAPLAPEAQ
jgi:hypothetical protein